MPTKFTEIRFVCFLDFKKWSLVHVGPMCRWQVKVRNLSNFSNCYQKTIKTGIMFFQRKENRWWDPWFHFADFGLLKQLSFSWPKLMRLRQNWWFCAHLEQSFIFNQKFQFSHQNRDTVLFRVQPKNRPVMWHNQVTLSVSTCQLAPEICSIHLNVHENKYSFRSK